MSILDIVLGRRLASSEQDTRKIGWFEGVPAMGLDGLGSASYGPEAALTIMIPLGAASLDWIGPVMAPIIVLLAILYMSYRQTVVAYPTNGGAYTVAKENRHGGPSADRIRWHHRSTDPTRQGCAARAFLSGLG